MGKRIDKTLLKNLNRLARRKFSGNEYLWRRVNVFNHHDIVHDFIVSERYDDQIKDRLNYSRFRDHIIDCIRKAKPLDRKYREYPFSRVFPPDNPFEPNHNSPNDEVLTEEDLINAEINKSNPVYVESLSWIGAYKNPLTGEPVPDAMAWDMKREMLRQDRYWMAANDYEYYRLLEKEKREMGTIKFADWKLHDPYIGAFLGIVFSLYPQKAREAYRTYLSYEGQITQADIAKIIGIHRSQISRYRKHPATHILKKMKTIG